MERIVFTLSQRKKKVGFGLTPIFTLSSQPISNFDGRQKVFEIGSILTGTVDLNRLNTVTYGAGFVSNNNILDLGFLTDIMRTNALVVQGGYYRKFLFIEDVNLNFSAGLNAIYQNGIRKFATDLVQNQKQSFQSLTLAPVLRIEFAITKYFSVHSSIGIGFSYTTADWQNVFYINNFWLKPLQRNNLLGQTGFTIFL
ncbi:MAG: hypothetical protein R3279_04195 [Putridiphycobacter sp.]|nr:hypothetical protein [Putridiphycobacter sp.]